MIGCSYIYENEVGYFWKHNELFKERDSIVFIDNLDFDRYSFKEFIDYLKRQNISQYVFLGGGNRLKAVVAFLNAQICDIAFYQYTFENPKMSSNLKDLMGVILPLILERDYDYDILHKEAFISRCQNGIYHLFTGNYPQFFHKYLIKHIYVDNIKVLDEMHTSLFLSCAINSVVYYLQGSLNELKTLSPTLVLSGKNLLHQAQSLGLRNIPREDVLSEYEQFELYGDIKAKNLSGYFDMAFILGRKSLNRLFISKNAIYADYQGHCQLSESLNISNLDLKNRLSLQGYGEKIAVFINEFIVCLSMMKALINNNTQPLRFTLLKSQDYKLKILKSLVCIEREDEIKLYDTRRNKLYNVNSDFLYRFKNINKYKKFQEVLLAKCE